jgi:hypothetical protein
MRASNPNQVPARRGKAWIQRIQERWLSRLPDCSLPACVTKGRVWTRVRKLRTGVRLEGQWYCSPECLETALRNLLSRTSVRPTPVATPRHVPLGLLMLSRGKLTPEQLRRALDAQTAAGYGRIGDWLKNLGYSTEEQISAALGVQWSCPVFSPPRDLDSQWISLLPRCLEESFRMLPVHYSRTSGLLYLGFAERVDYTALHTIERMLDCRAMPCLITPSSLERGLTQLRTHSTEYAFESGLGPGEMVRITASYVARARAEEVRVAASGGYIWARLTGHGAPMDLLFRAGTDSEASSERALSLRRRSTAVTA